MARRNPNHCSVSAEASHSRSSSQPSFFANTNCLLPPLPPCDSSIVSSNSNSKKTMEETDAGSNGSAIGLSSFPRGHHRSISEVPLGFSDMIQSSPQLVPIFAQGSLVRTNIVDGRDKGLAGVKTEGDVADDMLNSFMNMNRGVLNSVSDDKDKDAVAEASNSKPEPVAKHCTSSKIHHYRSLSMDSSSLGHFHFEDSRSSSLSDTLAKINLDFGISEFNEFELKKIMADERLAEIVSSDPKRVKRILANRQSAARSKERKMRYISELEHKVRTLQAEATTLSAKITILQKDNAQLDNQNNELKLQIQAMQKRAHHRDALHDTLTAKVQQLKCEGERLNGNGHSASTKQYMFFVQGQHQLNL